MTFRVLFWTVAFSVATAVAQTNDAEIAGRIKDTSGASLPGVQITVTSDDDQSRTVITDREGRFILRSLTTGTYRVVAELPGFMPASGEIRLSSSGPRAFVAWPLQVGCLAEDVRINLGPRKSAPLVDAILHMRTISADGPVLMSGRPDCPGRVLRRYTVLVLGRAPGRGRSGPGPHQVFMAPGDARLEPGREYLALLWPDARATADLVLPIVEGLVASPGPSELNGMRVDEALDALGNWAQERQR